MKWKEYLKELTLMILGVLIALLIDNYREDVRDDKVIMSYLDIVVEDLNLDITHLTEQLSSDSAYAKKLSILSDVLTTNKDLPQLKFGLSSWTEQHQTPYRDLSVWDSLDFYTLELYNNTEYTTRKIGFSTIVNSNLGHRIDQELLKQITVYYTTDSDYLDFRVEIDDRCQWNAIPYLNKYQGEFSKQIRKKEFNSTLLRNEASGWYGTTLAEMVIKRRMIEKAKNLIININEFRGR